MQRFAGVLLEVQPLDADLNLFGRRDIYLDDALADDRAFVLRDLIALRQIRIEIILAIENGTQIDLRLKTQPRSDRLRDAFGVDHRQHPRHRGVDQRHIGVGLFAKLGRGAGEQLRARCDLRMDLEANHDLEIAGRALDEL